MKVVITFTLYRTYLLVTGIIETKTELPCQKYYQLGPFRNLLWDKLSFVNDTVRFELHENGLYRGADKSLARPGRKVPRKHVRDARDFNNI